MADNNDKSKNEQTTKRKKIEYVDDDGNPMSKNAWKKWQKKLKSEAAKKAKLKNSPNKQKKVNEKNLTPNQYFELRTAMVASEEKKGTNMYPHKFEITSSIPQYLKTYNDLKSNEELNTLNVSIAGRVMSIRSASKKLRFYDIEADGKPLQVVANLNYFYKGKEDKNGFIDQHAHIRRGDIIGATGYPG
eukprot:355833_1